MGKARVDRYGRTKEQKLQQENQQLKKQISSLRKQLSRIDLDRYSTIKDIIDESYQDDKKEMSAKILENLKQQWACKICIDGVMEIFTLNRAGETIYYRICSNSPVCGNRTRAKPYVAGRVTGIVRKGSQE